MAKPVKVVVTFDDGSSIEHSLTGITSIFVDEAAARRCNRNPPYKGQPTSAGNPNDDVALATTTGGQCYYVNGMIFCP